MDNSIRALSTRDAFQTAHILQNDDNKAEASKNTSTFDEVLPYAAYFVLQTIAGIFRRIFVIARDIVNLTGKDVPLIAEQVTKEKIDQLAFARKFEKTKGFADFINDHMIFYGDRVDSEELVNRVNKIAKKMEIKQEIDVYLTEIPGPVLEGSRGAAGFGDRLTMVFSTVTLQTLNREELDFVIARELSHFKNNDKLYETLLDVAIFVTEIAFAVLFSFWFIPLIEGASALGKIWYNRKIEKEAELNAVALTGKDGAKSYIEKMSDFMKRIRDRTVTDNELKDANLEQGTFLRSAADYLLSKRARIITENGDCRLLHFTSNPLSERLKYIAAAPEKGK